jgi:hypothetical protein
MTISSSGGRLAVAVSLCGALWMAQVYGQQPSKLNDYHP